ncbi:armadillo-type protein [Lipomyces oligophaga]|uniref:armadillo-type protein n=1 Tax=Lipomyces oligophaga TaxID=45792 RepID=UPI0034CF96E0
MAEQEIDYSTLPLSERVTHKIWKVRLGAYEELTKQFTTSASENDPCFRPYLNDPGLYKKVVTDSNVAAQEAGITSLVAFLQYGGPNTCLRLRGTLVAPLAEKGLVSMRAGTKQKTIEALMYFIELDTPDPVIEELLPILNNKLPKLVTGTVLALKEIIKAFGTRTVNPKSLVKAMPKLFAHSDKNVRAETSSLAVILYEWMGDSIKTVLFPDLKPVQQKELEEAFEAVKGTDPQQTRFLLSQQLAAQGTTSDSSSTAQDDQDEELDPMDLVDSVDVSAKIPDNFYALMASTKWKERKEAVDELFKIVSVPKIAEADFNDLTRTLAKCIAKDANVAVVTTAANCVEVMAKGLRTGFAKYRSVVAPSLFERLKEKKVSVSEALGAALDATFQSTNLSEFMEDSMEFLKSKNPQVKQETALFLVRCLKYIKVYPKSNEIKQICDASVGLLSDTAKPVRSAAAEVLGTVMKMIGERAMTPFINDLDDIRKQMIKEYFDTAEVRAKPEKTSAPTSAAAPKSASKTLGSVPSRARVGGASASSARKPGTTPPALSTRSGEGLNGGGSSGRTAKPISSSRTSRMSSSTSSTLRKKVESEATLPSSPRPAAPSLSSSGGASGSLSSRGGNNRGLAGMALSSSNSTSHSSVLSAVDKQELSDLRRAKEEWLSKSTEFEAQIDMLTVENARMKKALSEITKVNDQLTEENTRKDIDMKVKDSKLQRARIEAEASQALIMKLQKAVEDLKSENQLSSIPIMHEDPTVEEAMEIHDASDGITASEQTSRRTSVRKSIVPEEEKENGYLLSSRRESYHSGSQRLSMYASKDNLTSLSGSATGAAVSLASDLNGTSGNAGSVESWKRAAEVTNQLKARIEAMKARQLRR